MKSENLFATLLRWCWPNNRLFQDFKCLRNNLYLDIEILFCSVRRWTSRLRTLNNQIRKNWQRNRIMVSLMSEVQIKNTLLRIRHWSKTDRKFPLLWHSFLDHKTSSTAWYFIERDNTAFWYARNHTNRTLFSTHDLNSAIVLKKAVWLRRFRYCVWLIFTFLPNLKYFIELRYLLQSYWLIHKLKLIRSKRWLILCCHSPRIAYFE